MRITWHTFSARSMAWLCSLLGLAWCITIVWVGSSKEACMSKTAITRFTLHFCWHNCHSISPTKLTAWVTSILPVLEREILHANISLYPWHKKAFTQLHSSLWQQGLTSSSSLIIILLTMQWIVFRGSSNISDKRSRLQERESCSNRLDVKFLFGCLQFGCLFFCSLTCTYPPILL